MGLIRMVTDATKWHGCLSYDQYHLPLPRSVAVTVLEGGLLQHHRRPQNIVIETVRVITCNYGRRRRARHQCPIPRYGVHHLSSMLVRRRYVGWKSEDITVNRLPGITNRMRQFTRLKMSHAVNVATEAIEWRFER